MRQYLLAFSVVVAFADCRRVGKASQGGDASTSIPLPDGSTLTQSVVLDSIGQCALSGYRDFAKAAAELEKRTAAAETDPNLRPAARVAWNDAIDLWEKLEVFQFGPAASSTLAGGKDMREHIYSWPLGARCVIEQGIVAKAYDKPDFSDSLVATRGLWAAEYTLFYEGSDNGCSSISAINANGTWAALGTGEIVTRKASYARAVAKDVRARADALVGFWDPASGNFLAQLTGAGAGSTTYASHGTAFNAITDAMFYIEHATKDAKLAKPIGLQSCTTGTCPEAVESPFAHRSKQHLANNLRGFRMLFFGCGPTTIAFDDLLAELGKQDLADALDNDSLAAIAAVEAIQPDDLALAVVQSPAATKAAYDAIKKVTDRLKGEFVMVLDLELPKLVEGDND